MKKRSKHTISVTRKFIKITSHLIHYFGTPVFTQHLNDLNTPILDNVLKGMDTECAAVTKVTILCSRTPQCYTVSTGVFSVYRVY